MKHNYKILFLFGLIFSWGSCTDNDKFIEPSLDVTYNNINGIWKLTELYGSSLAEGSYVYIEFIRKPNTDNNRQFEMYDNTNSFSPKFRSGIYAIQNDDNEPWPLLIGQYDHSGGDWANEYYVTDLKKDKLTLVVKGDETDISIYTRVEIIPDNIIDKSGVEMED